MCLLPGSRDVEAGILRLELELFLLGISCAVFLAEESELVAPTRSGDPGVTVVRNFPDFAVGAVDGIDVVDGTSEDGIIVVTVVVSIAVDISVIGKFVVTDGFSLKTAVVVAAVGRVEVLLLPFIILFSGDSSSFTLSVSETSMFLRFLMND